MNNIALRTVFPLVLLIGTGFFSRKAGILKSGDQRVLSAYVYYFALPALFFVNMSEISYTREVLKFMLAGILPVLMILIVYVALRFIFRFSNNTLYLLIVSTVFGSLAFFGIPFIMFAFPTGQGERLAILSTASVSTVSVIISITSLELYKLGEATIWKTLKHVTKKLSRNLLILSILSGILVSFLKIRIPSFLSTPLHMLGGTTATVAIFMLGVFLFGRKYKNIFKAFKLNLLRMILLPCVAFGITRLLNLPNLESSILVLMYGMPVAVSMIVLSERYEFYQETIASLILISSVGAGIYLNLWLWLLGYH